MSRVAARGDQATGAGKGAFAAIFVIGTALALLLIVRARPGPEPFDPRSSAPDGATALVELLERSGAHVAITRTPPAIDSREAAPRMLILLDQLDDSQRRATLDFVDAGGVVVVADPASTLHAGPDLAPSARPVVGQGLPDQRLPARAEANVDVGTCTVGALRDLRGLFVPDGLLYPVEAGAPQCFGRGSESFVLISELGAGTIVGLGDNELFVNRHLRRADNSGLATTLLAPLANTDVVILLGTGTAASVADVGSGEDTLLDLVPSWVWMSLLLAALSFIAFAVSRSIRVGKVLDEPLATPIAGSELVAATGNLMQRAKHAPRAGWLLQTQLHRDLCRELHVDVSAPLADVDAAVSARSGSAPGSVEAVLREQAADDTQLLALSARIERIRKGI